jgi:hypothetical protein
LRVTLAALLEAPGGTTDIGNVAMSAMLGQGRGRVEMEIGGGPGVAGQANAASNSIGGAVVTCMLAIVGMNPPPGGSKASASGGRGEGSKPGVAAIAGPIQVLVDNSAVAGIGENWGAGAAVAGSMNMAMSGVHGGRSRAGGIKGWAMGSSGSIAGEGGGERTPGESMCNTVAMRMTAGIRTDPSHGEQNAILPGGSGDRATGAVGAGVSVVGKMAQTGGRRTGADGSGWALAGDIDMGSTGVAMVRAGCGMGGTGTHGGNWVAGDGAAVMRVTARARPRCCRWNGLSYSMGGSRRSGTWAGATCAVRARTNPPRDTLKGSSLVGGSEPSGMGGGCRSGVRLGSGKGTGGEGAGMAGVSFETGEIVTLRATAGIVTDPPLNR